MPNWTFNTLSAPKKVISKYVNTDNYDEELFDFNLVIPMPESLNIESGSRNQTDLMWFLTDGLAKDISTLSDLETKVLEKVCNSLFDDDGIATTKSRLEEKLSKGEITDDVSNEMKKLGEMVYNNIINYGHQDWYSWRCDNWGTKWNACDCYLDDKFEEKKANDETFVSFNTAWSPPIPVIDKIFNDNPNCKISLFWENEDWDGKHWWKRFKNGNFSSDYDDLKAGTPIY